MKTNLKELQAKVDEVNSVLSSVGILRLKIVNPKNLRGQRVNARYMKAETFHQLAENVKMGGTLESVPLIYEDGDEDRIISGHHRVEAAKAAGLDAILCMVTEPKDKDDIVSKQLAHNSLVGQDDEQVLAELFNSIKDIQKRLATGLQDAIGKLSYTSLNYRMGDFKEVVLMFLPEDIGLMDDAIEAIVNDMLSPQQAEIRLASMEYYDKFAKAMMRVKKFENIKSNGIAMMRLVELASERMEEIQTERNAQTT